MRSAPTTILALAPLASFEAPLWRSDLDAPAALLSEQELLVWSSLRRPERRRQWLAVRWLAKWAYLTERVKGRAAEAPDRGRADFEVVVAGAGHLGRFPAPFYREVDVLPADRRAGGPPRLRHRAQPTTFSVSLAHTRGWVACALGRGHPVGVDVEGIEARPAAFEAYAFAERERSWIRARTSAVPDRVPALQTWLWSMKEAAFKTGRCARRSCPEIVVLLADHMPGPTVKTTHARASLAANDALIDGQCAEWVSLELAGSVASVVRVTGALAPCMGRA
jgi:4'-phosphopantetheinyl transferase EntD